MLPSTLIIACLSTALSATAAQSSESEQRIKRDYGYGYDYNYDANAVQPATSDYDANAVQADGNNYETYQKWEDKAAAQELQDPNAKQESNENNGAEGWKDEGVAQEWKEDSTAQDWRDDNVWSASDYNSWSSESGAAMSTGSASVVFTQTGVGAKFVSSFTVTDPATIVTRTASQSVQAAGSPSQTIMNSPEWSPAPTPLALNQAVTSPTVTVTGVNAKFVCSTVIGVDALAAATKAVDPQAMWPAQVENVNSVYDIQIQPAPTPVAEVSRSPLFVPACGVSTIAPVVTITGVNAVQRGFVTITTSIDFAALSSSIAASNASPSLAAPAQAQNEQPDTVVIPGRKESVLPIGLGVLGGLILLGLIVVGYVTYERYMYRHQFRQRKAAERSMQSKHDKVLCGAYVSGV